jgi:hypothetical protein
MQLLQPNSSLRAANTMHFATSSCNRESWRRRRITNTFLRAAVPMRFVTPSFNPA